MEPKRETVKKWINKICKKAGIARESLGIIAGSRAELYFDGEWSSVSFDAIDELAEKGTDVVSIEKEGVCEILTDHADKYGIALLNTRGHLTEYCEKVMIKSERLGGHVVMMADYEYAGVKIASETPTDVPWIGVNDEMLDYFHLDKKSLAIDAENQNNKAYVEYLVKNGRHPPDRDLDENVGRIDTRFKDVDLDFLASYKRVEINAVLAEVGSERFFEYIKCKLKELYPTRDYNRAVDLPHKYEITEFDILPPVVNKFLTCVQSIVNAATEHEEDTIIKEMEKIQGFLEVKEKKKDNTKRLARILAADKNMKVVIVKVTELMQPGVLPEVKKQKNLADTDSANNKSS
jgi:hypothetical protein